VPVFVRFLRALRGRSTRLAADSALAEAHRERRVNLEQFNHRVFYILAALPAFWVAISLDGWRLTGRLARNSGRILP
jgi:hypothetical protein